MLIKLRAHTTQPLVIIFAEFYDDFVVVGSLRMNYQFASARKRGSHRCGS